MKKLTGMMLLLFLIGCTKEKINAPVASFTYKADSNSVTFTSTSANVPKTLDWDFGDGQKGSGSPVTHLYQKAGTYNVTLTAANSAGSNTITNTVVVDTLVKVVTIHTSFGDMLMWLYDETPNHKSNFLKLTEQKFFDSTTFHRVIPDFVIQGGDPNSKDNDPANDGYGGPGYTIPAEIKSDLTHVYGAVGAARDNNPQKASNGSQFYIVVNKAGDHSLDGNYTVFGQILSGMDVAEKIAAQSRDANDRPLTNIRMSVTTKMMKSADIKSEYGFDIK